MNDLSMNLMRKVVNEHGLRSGKTVVDVGSFDVNGTFRALFDNGYVGSDLRPGPNVDVIVGSPEWDALKGVDAVISGNTLEHVEDPAALLLQVCELLKPGGLLILQAPSDGPLHSPPWYRNYSEEDLTGLVRGSGFTVLSSEVDPHPEFLICTCVAKKDRTVKKNFRGREDD